MDATHLASLFLAASRHYLSLEYPAKLRRAVQALPADRLWMRPNEESNSVGNLLLHLTGNIRQWIVAGVGNEPFTRHRDAEFAARGGASAEELLAELERTLADVDRVLARLTADRLEERCAIQGRDLTVLDAILHVVEHFSYHLGQIVLVTKAFAPEGVKFYEDAGGLARPIWNDRRP